MKNIKLLILTPFILFTLNSLVSSEILKCPPKKLMNVKPILELAKYDKTTWNLYAKYGEIKYAPIKAEAVILDIDKYLKQPMDTGLQEMTKYKLIKKYRNNLDTLFQGLSLLGADQLGEFFYNRDFSLPFKFALYGDTAMTLLVSGAFIDNIYNTLKLTSRQRATKVVTTYILPTLKSFANNFKGKEIKYFGITCVYGSKDFSSENHNSIQAEFVAFIAPSKVIKKYVSNDITEDELVDAADVFICDRDMVTEMKKIKLSLE